MFNEIIWTSSKKYEKVKYTLPSFVIYKENYHSLVVNLILFEDMASKFPICLCPELSRFADVNLI